MRMSDVLNSTAQPTTEAETQEQPKPSVGAASMRMADVEKFESFDMTPEFQDGMFVVPEETATQWKTKGPIGFFEQWGRIDKTQMIPFWGGAESIGGSVTLLNAVNRFKEDKYNGDVVLKQTDAQKIGEFLMASEEERVRGVTIPGKILGGVSQLPAFMIEFLATGGAAALGKAGVKKLATTGLKAGAEAGLTKAAARVAAPIAGAAVRTAAMPQRVGAAATERMVQANLGLTDKGVLILEEANETPMTSFMKGVGDVMIENYSEVSGAWIAKAGGVFVPKALAKSMEKIFRKLNPNKAVRDLWTKAGYNGFLAELGEERLGDLLRAVTGVQDFGADDPSNMLDRVTASIPNGEELLVEAGVLAIPGLAQMSTSQAMKMIRDARKEPVVDNTKIIEDVLADQIAAEIAAENAEGEDTPGAEAAAEAPAASEVAPESAAAGAKLPAMPARDAEEVLILEGRVAQLSEESDQILDQIDTLEEKRVDLEKRGLSTKSIVAKQEKLAQQFDVIDSQIGELMTDMEPKVKLRDKILTTVGKTLNAIHAKVKEGVKVSKEEVGQAQSDLIKYLEASPLEAKDRAKFMRAVKNIQSFDDLAVALPEILDRVDKLQEARTKDKTKTRIRSILKKSKPRMRAGKPVGKFTADIQQIMDRARKAMDMPRFEAEVKIQANLSKASSTAQGLDPALALENRILDSFSDLDSRSLDELTSRLTDLEGLVKAGRNAVSMKVKARQERAQIFAQKALQTIQGDKPVTSADKPKKKAVEAVTRALKTWGQSISGWDDLLNVFSMDSKTKPFKSWLNENLSTIMVETKEKAAVQTWGERFRKLAMEKVGFKKESQFFKWLHDSEQEVDLGEFADADKKPVRLVLSRSMARKIWMDMQQSDLKSTIASAEGGYRIGSRDVNGITPEIKNAITTFLTPEDIEFAKAQIQFYRDYYPHINSRFRDDFGVDLPFNENYSPIRRETSKKEIVSSILDEREFRRSMTPGSFKSRTRNREKIVAESDVSVMMRHVIEMEHYLNWADKIRDIESVFGDSRVKNAIRSKFGDGVLQNVNEFVTDFIRGGGQKSRMYDAKINNYIGNFTISVLAVKPAMTLKQMTSFAAFADAIPTKDFVIGFKDFLLNADRASKILMNTDFMKVRSDNITRDIKDGLAAREFNMLRKSPTFKNAMLFFTKYGDRFAILMGGWPVYKYHFEKTGDHEQAVAEFTKFATRTQQSSYLSQLSSWQRSNSFGRLFTLFTSAQNQYLRQEISAVRDGLNGRLTMKEAAKKLAIYHLVLPNLFQYVANFGHWDDEEQIRASILGSLNGVFLLGDILDSILRRSLNSFADFDLEEFRGQLFFHQIKDKMLNFISDMGEGDVELTDIVEAVAELAAGVAGPLAGLPIKQIMNTYEGVTDLGEGEIRKGMLKLGGWSPHLVNKYVDGEE